MGLDVVGAVVPFATGLGQAYRTQRYLTDVANQANKIDTAGMTASRAGTAKHTAAENIIKEDKRPNLFSEESYIGGRNVPRGTAGSKRPDVVTGSRDRPDAAYDFKFGQKGVSQRDVQDIRNATKNQNLSVTEIRPGFGPTRINGLGAAYNLSQDIGSSASSYFSNSAVGGAGNQTLLGVSPR